MLCRCQHTFAVHAVQPLNPQLFFLFLPLPLPLSPFAFRPDTLLHNQRHQLARETKSRDPKQKTILVSCTHPYTTTHRNHFTLLGATLLKLTNIDSTPSRTRTGVILSQLLLPSSAARPASWFPAKEVHSGTILFVSTRAPENGEEEQALKDTNDLVWTKPQLIPRRASLTCFVSVPTWRQAAAPARHAASHASWMPWPLRYACKNPGGSPASVKESRREEKENTTRTICGIVPSLTCGEEVSGPGGVHDFDLWRRRAVGLAAVHGHATLRAEADDDHGCEPRQHLQVPFPDEGLGLVLVAEEDVDKGPGRRVVSAFGERRRWRDDRYDFFGGADTHFACGSPSLGASRAQISSLLLLTSSKLARSTDLVAF